MDEWLGRGGWVVAASERAARALTAGYHRRKQAQGLRAWESPAILDWNTFVRRAWSEVAGIEWGSDGRLVLNSAQERKVWAEIAAEDQRGATLLEGPRYRLAELAMRAHELLCGYAPRYLKAPARQGWQGDAAAFGRWLGWFDEVCRTEQLLSAARVPLELLNLLRNGGSGRRPELLLAGFDRLLPLQTEVLDGWGRWQKAEAGEIAGVVRFYEASDNQVELDACAGWCAEKILADPKCRILVVTKDVGTRRGQLERAFLRQLGDGGGTKFEFSLGVPLSQVALPRAAQLLLRWLTGAVAEQELDWLFSTGYAGTPEETEALRAHMRTIRRRGLERPLWTLEGFLSPYRRHDARVLPEELVGRLKGAKEQLGEFTEQAKTPMQYAEFLPQLLENAGFAKGRPLASLEFQAMRRWHGALEAAGSLGFDGSRIGWKEFLAALTRTMEETLFAPESREESVQIAGPTESAGLEADAVWFLGATEDAWPAPGTTHPLLPPEVQRESGMPHGSAQLDWELAEAVTGRVLRSSPEVCFSYARQVDGVEARASRLVARTVVDLGGELGPLPMSIARTERAKPATVDVEDWSQIRHPLGRVAGGSGVLTAQSQCPFQAFATARLGARGWEAAEACLTYAQRGKLLHEVLHRVWSGVAPGIRTHRELMSITDKNTLVFNLVEQVFRDELDRNVRERMPAAYLDLERERLIRLVVAWLDFEAGRVPFSVVDTEADHNVKIGGLDFRLRLDRLDQLEDGTVLVVDYKSGAVTPKSWDPPRPTDAQLPIYACFGLKEGQELGGLVFAQLKPGKLQFAGCVGAPREVLGGGLKGINSLLKNTLQAEQVEAWREEIERLAKDFLNGRAEVDPKEYPKTCEQCHLQSVCRIQEHRLTVADENGVEETGGEDEQE